MKGDQFSESKSYMWYAVKKKKGGKIVKDCVLGKATHTATKSRASPSLSCTKR